MLSRPTLSELLNRIRNDVLGRMDTTDVLRRSDAEVFARVLAGAMHDFYEYADFIGRQLIPDTAEEEFLERWASIWLIQPRKAAAAATGTVTFSVQAGAVVPSGTLLQALDGTQYKTTADATISGTVGTAPVVAVLPAAAGNRAAGLALALVSPIAGVASGATSGVLSGGSDKESIEALRVRLIQRIQTPPQGGAASDYVLWALEVAGVTRAWCYPEEGGPNTVTVRFVRDDDASIIPDSSEVAAVQAYINTKRPVSAVVTVAAPTAAPLNFTFSSMSPNTSAIRAAVQDSLADLIRRESQPAGTLLISHIRDAISSVSGVNDYVLTSPSANVVAAANAITTVGTFTWP